MRAPDLLFLDPPLVFSKLGFFQQTIAEDVNRGSHLRHFAVSAGFRDFRFQIAVRQPAHGFRQTPDRHRDTAGNTEGDPHRNQQDQGENADRRHRRPPEMGVEIIDVDAGTDDPSPGLVAFDVGDLGPRMFVLFRGLEGVFDKAASRPTDRIDELLPMPFAAAVDMIHHRLADQRLLEGMHHDDGIHVVDPEILVVVVAESPYGSDGRFLRFLKRQGPAPGQFAVSGDQAVRRFDKHPGRLAPSLQK